MTACGKAENLPLPTTIDTVRPTATTTPYTPTPTNIPCHGWHEMNKPQIVTLPKNNVTTQLTYNEEDLADGSKNFSLYMYDPNLKVGTEFQHVNGSELDILSPVKDKKTNALIGIVATCLNHFGNGIVKTYIASADQAFKYAGAGVINQVGPTDMLVSPQYQN